jgi:hypothetical protein
MNGMDSSVLNSLLVIKPFQNTFGSEVDGAKTAITYVNKLSLVACLLLVCLESFNII